MLPQRIFWILSCCALLFACGGETEDPDDKECTDACFSAPPPVCDGDSVITFQSFGNCEGGQCVYPPNLPVDCTATGKICEAGACVAPPSPCDDVVCDDPPANTCTSDGERLYRFAATGTCSVVGDRTSCNYDTEQVTCRRNQWCVDGACVPRPCYNVTCNSPPAKACDGDEIVTWAAAGTCDMGTEECLYEELSRQDCTATGQFCRNARCVTPNPCEGVVCNERPETYCQDEKLHTFAAGICSGGDCSYRETVTDCRAQGKLCRDNTCRFRFTCEDIVCETPPAPYCSGDELVTFGEDGVCANDDCQYPVQRTNCADAGLICLSGACIEPDPCMGESCFDRPAPFCYGDIAIGYQVPGLCEAGICRYQEVERDCAAEGLVCFAGDCESQPECQDVVCNVPPAAFCEDGLAISFTFPGVCQGGECEWNERVEDCAAHGQRCVDGLCESYNACTGVVCNPLPSPRCEGLIAQTWSGVGVCTNGSCNHDRLRQDVDCQAQGMLCVAGACVPGGGALEPDALMITELMIRPMGDDPDLQWFEIYATNNYADLSGLVVRNKAGQSFTLPAGSSANPYFVVGASEDAIPGGPDFVWPASFTLQAADDEIRLVGNGNVDLLVWASPGWTFTEGRTLGLDAYGIYIGRNDDRAHWCNGYHIYDGTSYGTPRSGNGTCGGNLPLQSIQITEVMPAGRARPGGTEQWIEITNTTTITRTVGGLRIGTRRGGWVFPYGTQLLPGQVVVIGNERSVGGGPDYVVGNQLALDPLGDVIQITFAQLVIDTVDFSAGMAGGFPYDEGVSMQRIATSPASAPSNWCAADESYEGYETNFGTPGEPTVCAPPEP